MTVYVIEVNFKALGVTSQLAMSLNRDLAEVILKNYQAKTDLDLCIKEYQFDSNGMIIFNQA